MGYFKVSVTGNAQGIAGLLLGCGQFDGNSDYWISAGNSAIGALTWTVQGKPFGAQLRTLTSQSRLVSAKLSATFTGTTLTDQGIFTTVYYPTTFANQNPNTIPPVAYTTDVANTAIYSTLPVNKKYAELKYLPVDYNSWMYSKFGNGSVGTQTARTNGFLLVLCSGLSLSAPPIIEFTIVENYEWIPAVSTLNLLSPTPSKSDPIEQSLVMNKLSADPYLAVRPAAKNTSAETQLGAAVGLPAHGIQDDHPMQKETFFEKLLGGIDRALPTIEKVVKTGSGLAQGILPLLA